MNIKKAGLIFAICCSLVLSACHAGQSTVPLPEKEYNKVSMLWVVTTGKTDDFDLIQDEVNRITREKIGVEVDIHIASSFINLASEKQMLGKEGITIDVPIVHKWEPFEGVELDALLAEYGQGILSALSEEQLSWGQQNKKQLLLPSKGDNTISAGVAMRKDILDRYNIDAKTIGSLHDLDLIFQKIRQHEPTLKMISPIRTDGAFFARFYPWMGVNGHSYAVLDTKSGKIENIYETEEYAAYLALFRTWFLKGYLPDELFLQSLKAEELIKTGELFCFLSACKPGIEAELQIATGTPMVVVPLMQPKVTYSSATDIMWGISKESENPEAAMKLLNLLYSDPDIINLLSYGIRGMHYTQGQDTFIDFPAGIDITTSGYPPNIAWFAPNQSLSYLWKGYPIDVWEETEEFDRQATRSEVFYFFFEDEELEKKISDVKKIAEKYSKGLESGMIDPELYLPSMLEELDVAGMPEIMDEMNAQYRAWLGEK